MCNIIHPIKNLIHIVATDENIARVWSTYIHVLTCPIVWQGPKIRNGQIRQEKKIDSMKLKK